MSFSNDIKKCWGDNAGFHYEIQHGMPRGEIIGVYVGGTKVDSGVVIGESYDEQFLMKIAEDHSKGYQSYLEQINDFRRLKSEGKLKKDKNGNDGIEKTGQYGKYYLLEKDIVNPYVGPNKIKMLCKSAGKHFFKKYVKMRNAMEMSSEWTEEDVQDEKTMDQTADSVLEKAAEQFTTTEEVVDNIKDAEIVVEKTNDEINNL